MPMGASSRTRPQRNPSPRWPRTASSTRRDSLDKASGSIDLQNHSIHTSHLGPREAAAAGCLDTVVAAAELMPEAYRVAAALASIDLPAHARTKRRLRAPSLAAIRAAIDADDAAIRALV